LAVWDVPALRETVAVVLASRPHERAVVIEVRRLY
jgi:hypothetical protein